MCILFIYRNPNADIDSYQLIVATNRDEVLERPALPAHYWQKHPKCLGGTDMEPGKEGGTWLALSKEGKAGVILNLVKPTGVEDTPKKGRGSLITKYISSDDSAESYLNKLHEENQNGQPYNPYHLVLINLHNADVHYLNSSTSSTGPYLCENKILGFGNSGLEVPYKKVVVGKEKFQKIAEKANVSQQDELIEKLVQFLKSTERHLPDPVLKKCSPSIYKDLSSIFVKFAEYGTRTHSLILVNGANKVTFIEETLMPDFKWKRQMFNMTLKRDDKH